MIAPNTIVGGRYKVVRPLGGGGMKLVYLAEDMRLASRRCALAEMVDSLTNPDLQRQAAAAFQREADMLAQLSNEHIPRVFDYFSERNHHYLVMEFIDGDTLEEDLKANGGMLPEPRVIEVAIQVLDTLVYLHGLSPPVIYRDLKPSNIMIARSGQAKLIDFGIARHFQPLSNATMIGTQGYAPPEQYRGKIEMCSDLYALGATMHHCLSGRDPSLEPPFSFPPLRTLAPAISPALAVLIDQALEYDSEKRVASAQEFRRRLAEIKNGVPQPIAAAPIQPPPAASSVQPRSQLKLPLGAPAHPANSSQASAPQAADAMTAILGAGEIPCPGCRRPIPADSRFCSYCATDLRHIVLKPSQVANGPNTATASLPNLGTNPNTAYPPLRRRSFKTPILILIAIFAFAFFVTRLISYLSSWNNLPGPGDSSVPAAPAYGGSEPESDPGTSLRAGAIRRALDFQGYKNVRFRIEGDTIVLWGSVPTQADRVMVQTIVFTVGNIYSLEDHVTVANNTW
ncbi:MAG: protein kinase [Candidatus Binataceae bacterium]|nr:protein kinase [Candidatus Binataceae bacterium]